MRYLTLVVALAVAACTLPSEPLTARAAAPTPITAIQEVARDTDGQCVREYSWLPISNSTMYLVQVTVATELPGGTTLIDRVQAHTVTNVSIPVHPAGLTTFITVTVTVRDRGKTSAPYSQTFLCG